MISTVTAGSTGRFGKMPIGGGTVRRTNRDSYGFKK
jgi:hypothetical protein